MAFFPPAPPPGPTNVWSAGYPKTGTNNGTILVKGTVTPLAGWTILSPATVVAWPKNGGRPHAPTGTQTTVNTMTGVWGEAEIGGLTSNQEYNVVVQVTIQNGAVQQVVITPPGLATAK